jgi:hypothetical protein
MPGSVASGTLCRIRGNKAHVAEKYSVLFLPLRISRDGVVGIVTRLLSARPWDRSSIPCTDKRFVPSPQTPYRL